MVDVYIEPFSPETIAARDLFLGCARSRRGACTAG